jgi:type IV pilus assembly protein PilM
MAAVNLIGLDIGSTSIRAVETTRGKDGPAFTNFGHVPLPDGTVQSGVIIDDKVVTHELKQLWAARKFRTRKVALGLTNPQVVVRPMTVANLPARELRKSLPFQVRDSLPLAAERSLLDFHPLEDPGNNETVRGLLIAAPKDAVLAAVRAVEQAGLHVERVDLASFALLRSASQPDSAVEALVDLGAHSTTVIVHTDGKPLIARTIPRGGVEITEMLAARLGIDAGAAETLKCRIGVRAEEGADAAELVRSALRPVINEIRSSFAYLNTGDRPAQVARLALSGGGSLLPGLVELLREQLGVRVGLADPTLRLRGPRRAKYDYLESMRSSAAVSIGLAMGAA